MLPITGVWASRYSSVIICVASSTLIRWLGFHQCKISWKLHLSGKTQYLIYYDLQSVLQNINKFAEGLFSLILEAAVNMNFAVNFVSFLEHLFCITCINHTHNRCSKRSCKIHWNTPVLESLFNKAAGLRPATLLKRHFSTGAFLWILKSF